MTTTTTVDAVIDDILSNRIDKQEAMQSFDSLSEQDKNQFLSQIKQKLEPLPADDAASAVSESLPPLLQSVHELSMSDEHKAFIAELGIKLTAYAPTSKANALKHQEYFVDQRKTAGLKNALKSIQFQLTYEKAIGPYMYDVDGNRYIDTAGDNGVNLFGHQPPFMKKALAERLELGAPLVGYSEDLFEAARLFGEITGHERVVFAQSGTEAVMWSVRIARAASLKKKIVVFDGSYHGLSDAVFAFRDRKGKSMAPGLGMLQEFADQLIILDYGKMEDLKIIEEQAADIACVLCEPVQSRFPDLQPKEFVKELRKLTIEKDVVLIFDEMITGLRACCRGAEGFYNVKPDIGVYGKIPGGGMPTGVIAGAAKYLDYVDGGTWSFDDDSMPKLKRTFMAGTHTQNPYKITACLAILRELKSRCKVERCDYDTCFLSELNHRTEYLSNEMNQFFKQHRLPMVVDYFSSLFRFKVDDDEFGVNRELFVVLLKLAGVETSTSGNCFLTTEHGDEEVEQIIAAMKQSALKLIETGFFFEPEVLEVPEEKKDTPLSPSTANPTANKTTSATVVDPLEVERLKMLLKADLQNVQAGGA